MPPPICHPSGNAIVLVAVVQRDHSCRILHASAPNYSPQHPSVLAAQAALIAAPDFIFPSTLLPPQLPPQPLPPQPPPQPPPNRLPVSSSAVYLALSEPASDSNPSSFNFARRPKSPLPFLSRTFSNLSSANTNLPPQPLVIRRPTSSPPPRHRTSPPSSSSPDPTILDDESYQSSIQYKRRQFRATLLSATAHVFAITAQDGSRNYAFCRPLSPSHAIVIVSTLSHTALYVSALERTAATFANLVDDALSVPPPVTHPPHVPSRKHSISSSFIAENIMRCPPDIANKLTEALLTWIDTCSLPPSEPSTPPPFNPSNPISYITASTHLTHHPYLRHPPADVNNNLATYLTSSTSSSARSASASRILEEHPHHPLAISDTSQPRQSYTLWDTDPNSSVGATNSNNDKGPSPTATFPWEVLPDTPNSSSISAERIIELADATLLLRHFSVRTLMSLLVALLEERRVCLVGPNTAVVSRAVVALDNLLRPFKWPHLVSPILLARILPVLGAPFPYLVGILEEHFPATKDLPLEDVVFGDISTGKATTVEGPGDLYKHIPRRIRSRLERRLTRAKIACTRQILRCRSMLFSPSVSNTATSIVEFDDPEEFAKKEKPRLLKRSRSFVRSNEVLPQNIWLDQETTAAMDKAMRKFFAELLEGSPNVCHVDDYGKFDLDTKYEGFNQFLFPSASSTGMTLGSSKRDFEKRQLALSFQRTQMFMQWQDEEACDPTFGMGKSQVESQPGNVSRKRSKDRDISFQPRKGTVEGSVDVDEDLLMKSPKFKIRLTSDLDDILSGDDGQTTETGVMRKRFRSKRKMGRLQGVRLQFSNDLVKNEVPVEGRLGANANDKPSKSEDLLSATDMSGSIDDIAGTECETDCESEVPARRPWLSLRLPSSPWSAAREWTTLTAREGDTGFDGCEQSDDGEETDPFDEAEESADITDMFPIENVGTSWTRMRQWSRRKNRRSARV